MLQLAIIHSFCTKCMGVHGPWLEERKKINCHWSSLDHVLSIKTYWPKRKEKNCCVADSLCTWVTQYMLQNNEDFSLRNSSHQWLQSGCGCKRNVTSRWDVAQTLWVIKNRLRPSWAKMIRQETSTLQQWTLGDWVKGQHSLGLRSWELGQEDGSRKAQESQNGCGFECVYFQKATKKILIIKKVVLPTGHYETPVITTIVSITASSRLHGCFPESRVGWASVDRKYPRT